MISYRDIDFAGEESRRLYNRIGVRAVTCEACGDDVHVRFDVDTVEQEAEKKRLAIVEHLRSSCWGAAWKRREVLARLSEPRVGGAADRR